jgi:hypothetical protein
LAQTRTTTYGIDGAPLQPRHVKWGSTQVVESDGLIRQLLVLVNFKAVFGDSGGFLTSLNLGKWDVNGM